MLQPGSLETGNALAFCTDAAGLPAALFAAHSVAQMSAPNAFDIWICSFEPLPIPEPLAATGIRNHTIARQADLAHLPDTGIPRSTYLRLHLPQAFGARYDRIVYLDFDTRCMATDVHRLFGINLGPHAFGAVLDKMQWHHPDEPVLDFRNHGIECTRYINSGVLLIDAAVWRTRNLTDKILDSFDAATHRMFNDQSLINLALQGNMAELSPVWNWQLPMQFPKVKTKTPPKILHFTGRRKPWEMGRHQNDMDRQHIIAYRDFFAEHDLAPSFDIDPSAMRLPSHIRLKRAYKSFMCQRRIDKLMRRYPDPFQALI
ncbi:glycosyl transferase family 8 [Shimia isoporae]|uniref:Glycosyl transferase family 8 n=1 Tax=Shimia isoporae TaxID=647720 RepID=A0A4R1N2Z5_9RHOB|nr:glycosyltransferase [Shimia isoporae]TCK99783.1 glycosyl transferase family 8 [Shimia isoporae]